MTITTRTGTHVADQDGHHRSSPIMKLPRGLFATKSPVPVYHRLAGQIRELIDRGAIPPDEQLPSEQAIAEHLHISRPTVRHALEQLCRDDLIRREHGRGTFVEHRRTASPRR